MESCPDYLKPLAELQYRGAIWSQINTKDWTILAFLKSDQGGLGLDVAQDQETKNAMLLALGTLLDEEIELLKGKRLDKDYFNTLLTGGDPVKDLLQWLDQGESFKRSRGENEWKAFVEVCKSQFAFNPDKEGLLTGVAKLASHEGPWHPVWERFCEAPVRYPNIPEHIRKCKPPGDSILWRTGHCCEGWPQWNEEQEGSLRRDLNALGAKAPHEARLQIINLEKHHAKRRNLVWAELGQAPLALALEHLAKLAEVTTNALAGGSVDDLVACYRNSGWQADDAVVKALSMVSKPDDQDAVFVAIRTIYTPWADESARYLQKIVEQAGYPGGSIHDASVTYSGSGECMVFIDGLRYDVARRLAKKLVENGYRVEEKIKWAALPTVTATGKPAVVMFREKISGQEANIDFEPKRC